MPTPVRLVSLVAAVALALLSCGSSGNRPVNADEQVRFGVDMARRGLWSEAFFRFQQAQRLGAASDGKLLNNLAVTSEALGKFEQALDYYKQALQMAPGDAELKTNYDHFVSFYESFRARDDEKDQAKPTPSPTPAAGMSTPGPPNEPAAEDEPGSPSPSAPVVPPVTPAEPRSPGPPSPQIPPPSPPEPEPTPPSDATVSLTGGNAHA